MQKQNVSILNKTFMCILIYIDVIQYAYLFFAYIDVIQYAYLFFFLFSYKWITARNLQPIGKISESYLKTLFIPSLLN